MSFRPGDRISYQYRTGVRYGEFVEYFSDTQKYSRILLDGIGGKPLVAVTVGTVRIAHRRTDSDYDLDMVE